MHQNSYVWYKVLRQELVQSQNMRCKYCLTPITFKTATIDHVRPKSQSGPTTRENVVAACVACNRLKKDMNIGEFNRLIRKPPKGQPDSVKFLLANMRLRLSKRTMKACERIQAVSR